MRTANGKRLPMFKVRKSKIHGSGVFALRRIRKGTRLIEYTGDRISHDEADLRYEDRPIEDNHTFLFIVDKRTVIDAGVGGSDARFINHGCAPSCETVIENRRVFIDAIRTIQPGEELSYDYQIQRDNDDPPNIDEIFACRCGAKTCRGSMLEVREPAPVKARAKKKSPVKKSKPRNSKAKNSKPKKSSPKKGKPGKGKPGKSSTKKGKSRKSPPVKSRAGKSAKSRRRSR